jgi:hypothetical protein
MHKHNKKELISGIAGGFGGGLGVILAELFNLELLPMVLLAIVCSVLTSIIIQLFLD